MWRYLWPKITFKTVQEFPTVSLDFTKQGRRKKQKPSPPPQKKISKWKKAQENEERKKIPTCCTDESLAPNGHLACEEESPPPSCGPSTFFQGFHIFSIYGRMNLWKNHKTNGMTIQGMQTIFSPFSLRCFDCRQLPEVVTLMHRII